VSRPTDTDSSVWAVIYELPLKAVPYLLAAQVTLSVSTRCTNRNRRTRLPVPDPLFPAFSVDLGGLLQQAQQVQTAQAIEAYRNPTLICSINACRRVLEALKRTAKRPTLYHWLAVPADIACSGLRGRYRSAAAALISRSSRTCVTRRGIRCG
jgi:hypothetical protein